MRNPTHLVIGACAAVGLGYVARTPTGVPEVAAGALAALLPNVDYVLPRWEQSSRPILRRLAGRLDEGGITHSALVMLPLSWFLGLVMFVASGRLGMLSGIVAGTLSHLLLDLAGPTGVQLWAPQGWDWIAFPPWPALRPQRGGPGEQVLLLAGGVLLTVLAILQLEPYAGSVCRLILDTWRGGP